MKCFACGIDKDLNTPEVYPYPEEQRLCDDPIPPLMCIECESRTAFGKGPPEPWRMVVICLECFHRLQPDMWINEKCWNALNPVRPYDSLPHVKDSEKFNPENYE